jgi:two-component system LytT family response regulator
VGHGALHARQPIDGRCTGEGGAVDPRRLGRGNPRARRLVVFSGVFFAALVLGLAYIFFFNAKGNPLGFIYATMIILVVNSVTHFYTVSHLTAATALKQIDSEFEAVSASLKVSLLRTMVRVTIPVCLPAILDISMPGENGFQFLESIQKDKYSIVFVTAHDEYAIRAFKANAVDYLLKPVDAEELKTTISRLEHLHHLKNENSIWKKNYSDTLTDLLHRLRDHGPMEKIAVHHQQGFTLLPLSEIIYLEADSNYTILHLQAGQKIISTKTLSEYEELLEDASFFRIHKSTMINLRQLKEYSRVEGDFAVMNDKTRLDISRRRLPLFLEKMSTFSTHT